MTARHHRDGWFRHGRGDRRRRRHLPRHRLHRRRPVPGGDLPNVTGLLFNEDKSGYPGRCAGRLADRERHGRLRPRHRPGSPGRGLQRGLRERRDVGQPRHRTSSTPTIPVVSTRPSPTPNSAPPRPARPSTRRRRRLRRRRPTGNGALIEVASDGGEVFASASTPTSGRPFPRLMPVSCRAR